MPYRLNKGVYAVRCRHSHCPFHDRIDIEQNIMGVTEDDVRSEALKNARDKAVVKHDSIYGRHHGLENPEIHMISGSVQAVGINHSPSNHTPSPKGVVIREFGKGDVILRKGEAASTVCEVIQGYAYPARNKTHRYSVGDCFGAAALLPNHRRMTDVVAGSDRTSVAFYDLTDLRQTEPRDVSRLISHVMEDTLKVVNELGKTVDRLHKGKQKAAV
jgi:hypothetical protein